MKLVVALLIGSFNAGGQSLAEVKTIYVGSFGDSEDAVLIRSKVVTELVKSKRVEVSVAADIADAVLLGSGRVSERLTTSGTSYNATAGVQLVTKAGKIVWAENVSDGMFSRSASSSVASNIVKKLVKAMGPLPKRK